MHPITRGADEGLPFTVRRTVDVDRILCGIGADGDARSYGPWHIVGPVAAEGALKEVHPGVTAAPEATTFSIRAIAD